MHVAEPPRPVQQSLGREERQLGPDRVIMTDNPNPSVRSRQVSLLLRTLREDLGLSGAEVAKALGMSPSKISRIETGSRVLRVDDVA
jgi:DNA-binding XRE family transcriptional regulator